MTNNLFYERLLVIFIILQWSNIDIFVHGPLFGKPKMITFVNLKRGLNAHKDRHLCPAIFDNYGDRK